LKRKVRDIVSKRWPDSNDPGPKSLFAAAPAGLRAFLQALFLAATFREAGSGDADGTFDSIFAGCFSRVVDSDR
jgi:hypothetical protein